MEGRGGMVPRGEREPREERLTHLAFTASVPAGHLRELADVVGVVNKEGRVLIAPEAVRSGEKHRLLVDACLYARRDAPSFSPRGGVEPSALESWLRERLGEVEGLRGLSLSVETPEDVERIRGLELLSDAKFDEPWPSEGDLEWLRSRVVGFEEMVERARAASVARRSRSTTRFFSAKLLVGAEPDCEALCRASQLLRHASGIRVYPRGIERRGKTALLGLVCEAPGSPEEVERALADWFGCSVAACVPIEGGALPAEVARLMDERSGQDACLYGASREALMTDGYGEGAARVAVGTLAFPGEVNWEAVAQGALALREEHGIELLPQGTVRTGLGHETTVACRAGVSSRFGRERFGAKQAALIERYLGCHAHLRVPRLLADRPQEQREACDAGRALDEAAGLMPTAELFSAAPSAPDDGQPSARERLESLVGLGTVKKQVIELVEYAARKRERDPAHMPALHLCMLGPAGTGKTTVARLVGEMLGEAGVLEHPERFVEVDRSKLVAGYVGQTALKTQRALAQAAGGVLYIDEAYELGGRHSESDFGPEAIATLVKGMEDLRSSTVVILSGYTEPMKDMLAVNEGLVSRIGYFLDFEPYDAGQLLEVFLGMAEELGIELASGVRELLLERFERVVASGDESFGNARYARRLMERCEKHVVLAGAEELTPELAARALAEGDLQVGDARARVVGFC